MAIARAIKSINAGFLSNVNGFEVEKKNLGIVLAPKFIEEQQRLYKKKT